MGKPIANGNSLTLQPDEYDLDIHFSSLDYLNARKIRYAYRLAGLDKEWNYTTVGQHTVSYKHLPHGNYVFEVKATDGYGIWSEKSRDFTLSVCLPSTRRGGPSPSIYW